MEFLNRIFGPPTVERLKAKGDVPALVRALTSGTDQSIRRSAAAALADIGDKRAVEPLVAALQRDGERSVAASALGRLGDQRVLRPLIDALAVGELASLEQIDQALDQLDRGWTRAEAVITAIPALIRKLEDHMIDERSWARNILTRIGQQAVKPLLEILSRGPVSDFEARIQAVIALGEIKDSRATGPLLKALKETTALKENHRMRVVIARAFRNIGNLWAVDPLIRDLLSVDDYETAETVQEALDAIAPEWRSSSMATSLVPGLMERATRADTVIEHSDAGQPLRGFGIHAKKTILSNSGVRRTAILLLGRIGDLRAIDMMIAALTARDVLVQCMAAEALEE